MRGKIIFILVLLQAGLIGCNQSVSEVGSTLLTNALFNINYIDSVSIKVSTVVTDSLITSNTSRLLVGYHDDQKLGKVSAKGIFQVGINSAVQLDRNTTNYVSLKLYLKRDNYSYYDTTQEQTIFVHRVNKDIKLFNGFLYNKSKYSVDAAPIGQLSFLPRPHLKDSLEIPMSDALGMELMQLAQTNDIRLSSNIEFQNYFKGLALIPDSSASRNMIGFLTTKAEMRLYYYDTSTGTGKDSFISFQLGSNFYFNNINSDRSGTALSSIQNKNDAMSSNDTDHEAYFQAGAGLALRIEMPYLRDFLINDRNFQSSRTLLELFPLKDLESKVALPTTLYLYRVDVLNRLISTAPQGAALINDVEFGQNTHYVADITNYINYQVQLDQVNDNGLLIILDDKTYRSSVNRLSIGDGKNPYAMKAKLYYVTLTNSTNNP